MSSLVLIADITVKPSPPTVTYGAGKSTSPHTLRLTMVGPCFHNGTGTCSQRTGTFSTLHVSSILPGSPMIDVWDVGTNAGYGTSV